MGLRTPRADYHRVQSWQCATTALLVGRLGIRSWRRVKAGVRLRMLVSDRGGRRRNNGAVEPMMLLQA
jgi:hypothetical protein